MARSFLLLCVLALGCHLTSCIILVIPEDIPAGFAAIFGFSPTIRIVDLSFYAGNDHRFGFGFSLGNQADLQVQYELGPQLYTKQLQPVKVRSATYRQRVVRRRRPLLNFLLNLGLLRESSYELNLIDSCDDQPR